jgi:hypothetical protein
MPYSNLQKSVFSGLAIIYLLLVGCTSYAAFHRHGMVFDSSSAHERTGDFEFHDASCPSHTNAHLHFSDHCFTCKYFSDNISLLQSHCCLFDKFSSESLFQYSNPPFFNIFRSPFSGRAPPTFFA